MAKTTVPPASLHEALGLVRRLLGVEVARMRSMGIAVGEDEFRGLYTSDDEAERLLKAPPSFSSPEAAELAAAQSAIAQFARDDPGRFGRLCRLGGLNGFE